MKNLTIMLFALTMLIGITTSFSSCKKSDDTKVDEPVKKVWTIYIYGRPSCGYCSALKQDLDAQTIAYTFYDVDTQSDKNSEMWAKLNAAGMGGGSVGLPVVDVMVDNVSHMFIRPDVNTDIKPLIQD